MDRISRQRLFHMIASALHFSQKQDRKELERLDGLEHPDAITRVATRVCDQIDNDRRAVVQIAPDPGIPFPNL